MITIKSNLDMSMFKGDTGNFILSIKKDGVAYTISTGEKVYFSVKQSLNQETYTIQKEILSFNDGKAQIVILPTDTDDLDSGTYYYDIEWIDKNNHVHTLMPENKPALFVLTDGIKND